MRSSKKDMLCWFGTSRVSPEYFRKDFRFVLLANDIFALLLVILNGSHSISFRNTSSACIGYNS